MAGRLRVCVFVAACALGTQQLPAQGVAPAGGYYPQPAAVPNAVGTPWMDSTYGNTVGYPGADPNYCPPGNYPTADDGMVVQHTGYDHGDDGELMETPIEKAITRALHSSWVRFDYLHWSIQEPGDVLIGESTTTIGDGYLTQYYPLNEDRFFPDEYFRDVDLTSIGLNDVPGVQVTLGLPTTFGTFEWSGFMMQQASDEVIARDLPGVGENILQFPNIPLNVGITSTINGQHVSAGEAATLMFNNSFQNRISTDVWGTELNFICDPVEPGEGFKLRPSVGFRYLAFQEQMRIDGSNIDLDTGFITDRGKVSVDNFNNIYGPQVGCRVELVHRWFTIGAEPKVMLGANSFEGSMNTSDLDGNGPLHDDIHKSKFAAVGDLDVYARIPLGDSFAMFVSYNLMVTSDVARPFDNARFDVLSDGSTVTNNYSIEDVTKSLKLEGYTLGFEIIFP